jgi:hypothetical protein
MTVLVWWWHNLAREEEWKRWEDQNDKEMMHWASETSDGWGGVRIASPIVNEGWPSVQPVDCGYPSLEGPLGPDGWPDLSLPLSGGVLVTTTTTVEEGEGHSACMLPML